MRKRIKELLLVLELLKDSKRSDREIAKVLGISQPTVSRMRIRLVKEGMIREFTVIPDFAKMGYEIMAISCFRSKVMEELEKVTMARPNIIFASSGQGMGKNGVIISLHKNYTDFSKFLRDLRLESGDNLRDYDTILIGLREKAVKPLSLKYLAEQEPSEYESTYKKE
jgi:DNA-binding Lrp family transcriptional regulator